VVLRYPAPLQPGDRVGVTSPSSGVPADLLPRLDVCLEHLRQRGYHVVVGDCMDGDGVVSAPARDRAAELTAMLTDPSIRAVVPPWGGELAVEILPHLDWPALRAADPTWLVGYSDLSTLLLPLTMRTATATLYGQNLMDTPYQVPAPLVSWLDVANRPAERRSPRAPRPTTAPAASTAGRTTRPPASTPWTPPARGGCSTPAPARCACRAGSSAAASRRSRSWREPPTATCRRSSASMPPRRLLVYLEASGDVATDIARDLWRMRLAGWFDHANAVLVGRTRAPDADGFSQVDAVRSALDGIDVPVVLEVDCGHVPPHLALVNGAQAQLTLTDKGYPDDGST